MEPVQRYIFLTLNLTAVSGANMYIYNKTQYLKQQGYDVHAFSGELGEIPIAGLREFQREQMMYLRFYPGCFRRHVADSALDTMIRMAGVEDGDEVIVESSNIFSALWGEMLAEKLKCRHLCFVLTENASFSPAEKRFLRFKLARHELAGISAKSVQLLLRDDSIPFDESMHVRAFCNNTIDDCKDTISDQLNLEADVTFGSIGRLDKGYVLPLAKQLGRYFADHPEQKFNLVLVGGGRSPKHKEEIERVFSGMTNVNLVMPGFLFPVPRSFVQRCDLFINAAGASSATYYEKRPTIRLNPKTGDITGILGLTCQIGQYDIYASNAPLSELNAMIERALRESGQIIFVDDMNNGAYRERMHAEFARQLKLASQSGEKVYDDTFRIRFANKRYIVYNFLGKVLSVKHLYRSIVMAREIVK